METLTSFYSQLLVALQARIQALVPEIRYVDQDLGQLEMYDPENGRPAVSWPCLLIDFTTANYDDLHQGVQWATDTIQLRLGFDPYSTTANIATTDIRGKGLKYYELEQAVYKALQGWDGDGLCQPMSRRTGKTEIREDAFRVRVMTFTTSFEDSSAVPEMSSVSRPTISFE